MESLSRLLTPREAAAILGVSPGRLERWRRQKRGPVFVRVGPHARYPADQLASWIEAHTIVPQVDGIGERAGE